MNISSSTEVYVLRVVNFAFYVFIFNYTNKYIKEDTGTKLGKLKLQWTGNLHFVKACLGDSEIQ